MRRIGRIAVAGALAVAIFALGAIGLGRRTPPEAPVPVAPAVADTLASTALLPGQSLAQIVNALQARLRANPSDWKGFAQLGLAYVQEARVTADPSFYPKAEAALTRSRSLHPSNNFAALTGLAALAAARHDFGAALSFGRQATTINPYSADALAITGDALIELGRYGEAFDTIQRAVDTRPELSTYARASYALELQGNVDGAIAAMRLALASAGTPADRAWASYQLGELFFNSGDIGSAGRAYADAVRADPSYVPGHAGVAKVEAATGHAAAAIRDYTWVVERYPSPEFVIALGDLETVDGDEDGAAAQYALVHVEEQLLRANGVNADLEIALFDADHRVDLAVGLAAAQAEWARRKSVHVADAMAWSLYAAGRPAEALPYSDQALRLGTKSALFLFHRGMIERALDRPDAARRDIAAALQINPHFSILWADQAAKVLRQLEASR